MILSNTYTIPLTQLELHELCALHPKMDEDQFKTLTNSIMEDGQIQPVIVYRGKVIDGRHRAWALAECGIDTVNCVDIPRNTKLSDVRIFIMNTEKRRHQTKNQLTCAAYMDFVNPKTKAKSLSALALDYGTSQTGISQAKKISEEFGINVIEKFLVGEKVNLAVNGTFSNYATLASLYSAMKRTKTENWAKSQRQAAIGFNEATENKALMMFCMKDSLDLLKFKQRGILDLIISKEAHLRKIDEEFNNE